MGTPRQLWLMLILSLPSLLYARQTNAVVGGGARSQSAPALARHVEGFTAHPPPASGAPQGLIQLDVTVTDTSGKPISGVRPGDFTLLDNGQPVRILSFHASGPIHPRSNPPVEVILLIDTLQVPHKIAYREREEVERFLRQNSGHLAQPISLYSLGDSGLSLVAQAARDGNALAEDLAHSREVSRLRWFVGGPSTYGAMEFEDSPSLSALKSLGAIATAERRKPGRKILIWVGPGWGIGSGAYHEENAGSKGMRQSLFDRVVWFSTLLRVARVTLYSFSVGEADPGAQIYLDYMHGVGSARQVSSIDLARKVLAIQTGGRVLPPANDLVRQIDDCIQESGSFHTISFNPPPAEHPDEYHSLKLNLSVAGLTARTTTGYYDQLFYSDPPDPNIRHVTVAQLEQALREIQGQSGNKVARQLSGLKLTERLSDARLAFWTAKLHGKKVRQALVVLADESTFLAPPAADILPDAPPAAAEQQRIISLTTGYLDKTIPRLPDFYATRTSVHYQETFQYGGSYAKTDYRPLHVVHKSKTTVLYRGGHEVVDSKRTKSTAQAHDDRYFITYGTFGPLLVVIAHAIASGLIWDRWEQGPAGKIAVFRYRVPEKESLYLTGGCCLPDGDGTSFFEKLTAYHGEIAIDPATGAILRIELEADVNGFVPLGRSDIMVAYGPVKMGGETYICPVRSVSIWRARQVIPLREWDESFRTWGPYASMMNEFTFNKYHMFRAESRVLAGFSRTPEKKP
ncbi:MAG: VWA domain-containing protein [Acidobacteriaceae bacterium]